MATPKPSVTNCPSAFGLGFGGCIRSAAVLMGWNGFSLCCRRVPHSGGYSAGVPPLPIPNREVKPGHADGTAQQWESR